MYDGGGDEDAGEMGTAGGAFGGGEGREDPFCGWNCREGCVEVG